MADVRHVENRFGHNSAADFSKILRGAYLSHYVTDTRVPQTVYLYVNRVFVM